MEHKRTESKPSDKARRFLKEMNISSLMLRERREVAEICLDLNSQIDKWEKRYEKLLKENEQLKNRITELENSRNPTSKYEGYKKLRTWVEKVRFILERNQSNMTFEQVREILLEQQPELKEQWGNINKSVSHILAKACKYGAILKSRMYGNNGHFVYGLTQNKYFNAE